jgi:hypothetical protein
LLRGETGGANQRMQDAFKGFPAIRLLEYKFPQPAAI